VDHTLNADDGGNMRLPFRFGDRQRGFERGDGSAFVMVAPLPVDFSSLDGGLNVAPTVSTSR